MRFEPLSLGVDIKYITTDPKSYSLKIIVFTVYLFRFGMYGRKYQWVIMGTYTEEWWLRPGGGCAPSELTEALEGAILTDLLPLSTSEQITISGIVSNNLSSCLRSFHDLQNEKRNNKAITFHRQWERFDRK